MKKITTICIMAASLTLVGYLLGFWRGRAAAWRDDFDTYKVALVGYFGLPETRNVKLVDFLKARYYYYANRAKKNTLGEVIYDFGPVDFSGFAIGGDLTTPRREYSIFQNRFRKAVRRFEVCRQHETVTESETGK